MSSPRPGFPPSRLLPVAALLALASSAAASSPAAAQEAAAAAQRSDARFREYLARSPFHAKVFDDMVAAALAEGRLEELVASYRAAAAADPADRAARIVLARLFALSGEPELAFEGLEAVAEGEPEALRWMARLRLDEGAFAEAAELLEEAARAATARGGSDAELELELRGELAECRMLAGDEDGARAALLELGRLRPDDFHDRLRCAEALARSGFRRDAAEEYRRAAELAGADPARRCQVLAELGALHEAALEPEPALAVYLEALDLLGRGHWLAADLRERVLRISSEEGALDELVERTRARIAAASASAAGPADAGERELLALALERRGSPGEAREVLERAAADFPADLRLGERRIALLAQLGDTAALDAEYQRVLGEHPGERDLWLAFGESLLERGELERARRAFERLFALAPGDPEPFALVAGTWRRRGHPAEARALLERALELDPSVARFADLVRLLGEAGAEQDAAALLVRAEQAARGSAFALEELADLFAARDEPTRAARALEAALALQPDSRRLAKLADLEARAGATDAALDTLRRVIEGADDAELRASAVARTVELLRLAGRAREAAAREQAAVDGGSSERAPYLVLEGLTAERKDPSAALCALAAYLDAFPGDVEARARRAALLASSGALAEAVAEYDELCALDAARRRRYLELELPLLLEAGDRERAKACLRALRRSVATSPEDLRQVARWFLELEDVEAAIGALRQAVRGASEPGPLELELAELYRGASDPERAKAHVLAACRSEDPDVRRRAFRRLRELLEETGGLARELERLHLCLSGSRFDLEAHRLLSGLYVELGEPRQALALLDAALARRPGDASLREARGRLHLAAGRHAEAIADLERAGPQREAFSSALVRAYVEVGDVERAIELVEEGAESVALATLLASRGHDEEALRILRRAAEQPSAEAEVHRALGFHWLGRAEGDGDHAGDDVAALRERALAAFETFVQRGGDDWRVTLEMGRLQAQAGRREAALACGRRLFEQDAPAETIEAYFTDLSLRAEWGRIRCERLLSDPTDFEALDSALEGFLAKRFDTEAGLRLVLDLRRLAPSDGGRPARYGAERWMAYLDGRAIELYRRNPGLMRERCQELAGRAQDGAALGEAEWAELLWLVDAEGAGLPAGLDLEQAWRAHPRSFALSSAFAVVLARHERHELAIAALERLIELHGTPQVAAACQHRAQLARDALLEEIVAQAPESLELDQNRQLAERVLRLCFEDTVQLWSEDLRVFAGPRWTRTRLAVARARSGDEAAAREMLRALEPENEDALLGLLDIAEAWLEAGLPDDADRVLERVVETWDRLAADPELRQVAHWQDSASAHLARIADRLLERGQFARVYELFLCGRDPSLARQLLERPDAFAEVARSFAERFDAAARDSAAAGADDGARSRLQRAAAELAEAYRAVGRWDDLRQVYERVQALLPDHVSALENLALLAEWNFLTGEALALHERAMAAKRRWGEAAALPEWIRVPLPQAVEIDWATASETWERLRAELALAGPLDVRSNLLDLARVHLEARGEAEVLEPAGRALRELLERTPVEERAAWSERLGEVARAYDVADPDALLGG